MIKYSLDDEYFKYDTYLGAIFEMESPKVGDVYYSCEAIPVTAERLVYIGSILEHANENFYDLTHIEDCDYMFHVPDYAETELKEYISNWIRKYTNVESYYYFRGKSTKHFVTEEDLKELNDD